MQFYHQRQQSPQTSSWHTFWGAAISVFLSWLKPPSQEEGLVEESWGCNTQSSWDEIPLLQTWLCLRSEKQIIAKLSSSNTQQAISVRRGLRIKAIAVPTLSMFMSMETSFVAHIATATRKTGAVWEIISRRFIAHQALFVWRLAVNTGAAVRTISLSTQRKCIIQVTHLNVNIAPIASSVWVTLVTILWKYIRLVRCRVPLNCVVATLLRRNTAQQWTP